MEGAVGVHWEKEMKWGVKKVLPPTKVARGCKVKPFWGARREEALLVFGVIWFDLYVRPFGLTRWGSPPEGVLECRGRGSWLFCQWLNAEAVSRQRGEQHLPLTEARQGSSHLSVAAPISIYLKYWSEQGGSFCSDRILSMDTCENRKKGRKDLIRTLNSNIHATLLLLFPFWWKQMEAKIKSVAFMFAQCGGK